MYLLNRYRENKQAKRNEFTFHYVSIKSATPRLGDGGQEYLHSTMYLLNLRLTENQNILMNIYIPLCIY